MRATKTVAWLMGVVVFAGTAAKGTAAPGPREILGGRLIVKEALERLDVPAGRIHYLAEAKLARAFPDYLFYVVLYPPASATDLPEPLKVANLFAVAPDGRAALLARPTEWVEFFRTAFYPPKRDERCKTAVRSILLLLQARHPGYTFTVPEEDIRVTADPDGGKKAIGRLVVKGAEPGDIAVTLTLDSCCELVRMEETVNLKPVRLVAAADPAEIRTAEKVVKRYLIEEKLSADSVTYLADPALVRTIPGYVFFAVPVAHLDKIDPRIESVRGLIVVGPEGKPVDLFRSPGVFVPWFTSVFGPATDERRIQTAVGAIRTLLEARFPGLRFDPAEAPEITPEEGGVKVASTRVTAVGAGDRRWLLTMKIMVSRRGRIVAFSWGIRPEKKS